MLKSLYVTFAAAMGAYGLFWGFSALQTPVDNNFVFLGACILAHGFMQAVFKSKK